MRFTQHERTDAFPDFLQLKDKKGAENKCNRIGSIAMPGMVEYTAKSPVKGV